MRAKGLGKEKPRPFLPHPTRLARFKQGPAPATRGGAIAATPPEPGA